MCVDRKIYSRYVLIFFEKSDKIYLKKFKQSFSFYDKAYTTKNFRTIGKENYMITIRNASTDDAERLAEIYNYYVKNTAITFEYEPVTADEFAKRIIDISSILPYLVIVKDGIIEGYAYARPFIGRAAYRYSCETTIYLDRNTQKCGLGKILYVALENELKKAGIINLYACIAYTDVDDEYLTSNSVDFHEHLGYRSVGKFHKCGYKFGRWYSMVWVEKMIGTHVAEPKDVDYRRCKELSSQN